MTIAIWRILRLSPYVDFPFVRGLDQNQPRTRVRDLSGPSSRAYGAHLDTSAGKLPPGPKLGARAYGRDRRYPITNWFQAGHFPDSPTARPAPKLYGIPRSRPWQPPCTGPRHP